MCIGIYSFLLIHVNVLFVHKIPTIKNCVYFSFIFLPLPLLFPQDFIDQKNNLCTGSQY